MPNSKFPFSAISQMLKGNPKILGAPLAQGHVHFSSVWNLVTGLDQPQPLANFEIASFSHWRNIIGQPINFGELP